MKVFKLAISEKLALLIWIKKKFRTQKYFYSEGAVRLKLKLSYRASG
jgi:hypothetical protein